MKFFTAEVKEKWIEEDIFADHRHASLDAELHRHRDRTREAVAAKRAELRKLNVPEYRIEEAVAEIREKAFVEIADRVQQVIAEAEQVKTACRRWIPQLPDEWKATPERVLAYLDDRRAQMASPPDPRRFDGLSTDELYRRAQNTADVIDLGDIKFALEARAERYADQKAASHARDINLVDLVMADKSTEGGIRAYRHAYKTVIALSGTLETIKTGSDQDEGDKQRSYWDIERHREAGERGYANTNRDGTLTWIPEPPLRGSGDAA